MIHLAGQMTKIDFRGWQGTLRQLRTSPATTQSASPRLEIVTNYAVLGLLATPCRHLAAATSSGSVASNRTAPKGLITDPAGASTRRLEAKRATPERNSANFGEARDFFNPRRLQVMVKFEF